MREPVSKKEEGKERERKWRIIKNSYCPPPVSTCLHSPSRRTLIFLHSGDATVFCLHHEVTPLSVLTNQEQLKEDDVECIVNQDELSMNYQEPSPSPSSPATKLALDQKSSLQTPGKENIYEGDLGLGGYELKLEQTRGQHQMD